MKEQIHLYGNRSPIWALIALTLVIGAAIGAVILERTQRQPDCHNRDIFLKQAFAGRVARKYLDPANHAMPTLRLMDSTTEMLPTGAEDVYYRINIGDSVWKSLNQSVIGVRSGGKDSLYNIEFICDELLPSAL